MAAPDDEHLDALLARGRVSGPVRERVFERVLPPEPPAMPWWQRLRLAFALPTLAAAAALALFVHGRDSFQAKGTATRPQVELSCDDGACRVGATVAMRVDGATQTLHVAAWAEPEQRGERIWYFPDEEGHEPEVAPHAGPVLLPRGVRLGAEHKPGRYRVHVVLGPRVLSRADALLATDALVLPLVVSP